MEKKYVTPRGAAATKAKNKYRDKSYDRAELALPKGTRAVVDRIAKESGYRSRNEYIYEAIREKYKNDTGDDLNKLIEKDVEIS